MMGKTIETKVTVLFSKGGTVPVVPLLLHSDWKKDQNSEQQVLWDL